MREKGLSCDGGYTDWKNCLFLGLRLKGGKGMGLLEVVLGVWR